jgi:hypothetical protein
VRYLSASAIKDLPPICTGSGAGVMLMLFLSVSLECLQLGKDLPLDHTHTLWQLYRLLRKLSKPEEYRDLFAGLIKNLPTSIQMDIYREVRDLKDQGSVLLTSVLEEQIQPSARGRSRSRRRSSGQPALYLVGKSQPGS